MTSARDLASAHRTHKHVALPLRETIAGVNRHSKKWQRGCPDVRRCHQMSGRGAKFGRKREEAIAALLSNVEDAREHRKLCKGLIMKGLYGTPRNFPLFVILA